MRRWGLALAVVLCGAALARADGPPQGEWREAADARCVVMYHEGAARKAREVAETVAAALRTLEGELGVAPARPPKVWLAAGLDEFRRLAGADLPQWPAAVALLGRNEVVARLEMADMSPGSSMARILFHELCHLCLAETERGRGERLPVWFHEGVATYLSGARLFADRKAFRVAAAQGALIPLAELAESFPRDQAKAELAYLQSEDFVWFVVAGHGRTGLRWWLDGFRRGQSFEAAALAALGEPLAALETRWRQAGVWRFPWLAVAWEGVTLFGVLAVATVAVFFVLRARARRKRLEWEREEWLLGRQTGEAPFDHDEDEEDGEDDADREDEENGEQWPR